MAIDISGLNPEDRRALNELDAQMLLQIRAGMAHTQARNANAILCSDQVSEDGVLVVCGQKAFARMQALQNKGMDTYSAAVAAMAVKKAMGA
jgi:hypothetical protein